MTTRQYIQVWIGGAIACVLGYLFLVVLFGAA